MKILSIETSCDETAISIVEAKGGLKNPQIKILSDITISQVKIHAQYGGVFPALAKREHSKNLIPILEQSLKNSDLLKLGRLTSKTWTLSVQVQQTEKILEREPELLERFLNFIPTIKIPKIDAIAVTVGPGLEPALWVGVNFAKALSLVWDKPIIPVNHMEGHILASTINQNAKIKSQKLEKIKFPALALLLSGGHTDIIFINNLMEYKKIGSTRDDAVGEAYDKVARMLHLPYPGGPEISKLAEQERNLLRGSTPKYRLPRPMIDSPDLDFSFAGLKTAVLYMVKKIPDMTPEIKQQIAKEFEDAVVDVLIKKTRKVLDTNKIKTLIIGGGVSSNREIRKSFASMIENYPETDLLIPAKQYSTDNALMIAIAGYFRYLNKKPSITSGIKIKADGNLKLK